MAGLVGTELAGLALGALSAVLVTTQLSPANDQDLWVAAVVYVVAGLLAGLAGRVRHRRLSHLEVVANRLNAAYVKSLLVAADALELRDIDTAGHSRRVANNAVALGQYTDLAEDKFVVLFWAALLHDVGKIAVPEAILHKPGRLTDTEWIVMKSHSTVGEDLIRRLGDEFEELAAVVRSHHENWDGSGYPDGLAGDAIPRAARLLSVVDVYDALIAPRPYRLPLSRADALQHILVRRGTQFDPTAVDAFLLAFRHGALDLTPDEDATECSVCGRSHAPSLSVSSGRPLRIVETHAGLTG